jgi:hypothetical protein
MSKKKIQNKNDSFDLQSISDLIESKMDEKFDMLMDSLKTCPPRLKLKRLDVLSVLITMSLTDLKNIQGGKIYESMDGSTT